MWSFGLKALATLDIVKEIRRMNKFFNFKSYFALQLNLSLGFMTEHFQIGTKVVNLKKQSGTGLHAEYPLSGKHMFEVLASIDYWSGAIWFNTLHSVFNYVGGLKSAIWVCTLHIIKIVWKLMLISLHYYVTKTQMRITNSFIHFFKSCNL